MDALAARSQQSPGGPVRSRILTEARDALAADLRAAIRGEVAFDPGTRALYATDASNYRQVPIAVVTPLDRDELAATVEVCRRHAAPITLRGGGTSLAGQTCNVAVVIDCSRHVNRIIELDPDARRARVEPGVILDDLRAAAGRHGLTFGPDPATHDRCTIGGMLGNDSCGVHSETAGRTSDNAESLEVVTYGGLRLRAARTSDEELERIIASGGERGELYRRLRDLRDRNAALVRERFPKIPRLVSGYALDRLLPEHGFDLGRALVGTEGTCVTVLDATLRLVASPPGRALLLLGFPDLPAGCDHIPALKETGPIGLEGFGRRLANDLEAAGIHPADVRRLPEGDGWLILEFGGDDDRAAQAAAERASDRLRSIVDGDHARVVTDRGEQARVWRVREAALGATAVRPGQPAGWPGWEDSAVPPERLGEYLRELRRLLDSFGYDAAYYGHFGQGCVHMRVDFDFSASEGIGRFRSFVEQAADLVVGFGGSLSGEHGDGQARAELLPRMFGTELVEAFGEFKAAFDPTNRMNPGKVVEPLPLDDDLRMAGEPFDRPATLFHYPADGDDVRHAMLRCVGVGECRRESGALMCPSYQATRDERHSTRGRARLLQEMLRGDVIGEGWRSDAVHEALELCLACKGCLHDCPVDVDMATYKAEFNAHYYAGRLRPRAAYSMGLIHWWAAFASRAPWLVNAAARAPVLGSIARFAAGVDPARSFPTFAAHTFRSELRAPQSFVDDHRRRIVLWPDTFTDHFDPAIGHAAVRVLEAAGYVVEVPRSSVCCGRPLFDWGFIGQARYLLRGTMRALASPLAEGRNVVVLEPSCLSVFRNELPALFPRSSVASRLSKQAVSLGELLASDGNEHLFERLGSSAIAHGHCHEKAVGGWEETQGVLRRAGVSFETPEPGCCGMAGAFGFERGEKHAISMTLGERALLPAVRSAPDDALVVADGFSCREQIRQGTGRRPLHSAQVLAMALGDDRVPHERERR